MNQETRDNDFLHRCRFLKSRGFGYAEIAERTGATIDRVHLILTGKARKKKQSGPKPIEQQIAELIADVPEGRCPAAHRRCVMANFQGAT